MNIFFVLLLILAVRLASVFVVKTFYVPDEYWQSLEVAHKLAFGYGYITWEWVQGIRSYIYPLLIAGVYKALALLNLDSAYLLAILPRILQALLTTYSDYRFYVWTGKRKWALFLIVVPWFWFYTGSRTLTNTLEASLTTIALSYFPWTGESSLYLWPAALCCYLRPTAAIIWLPLSIYHLRKTKQSLIGLLFKKFLVIGVLVAALGIGVDTYLHGKLIITPYEFLKYNVFHNIGSFYGSHPWHWYFTIGLPSVLGIITLPFLFAVIETVRRSETYPVRKNLLLTIAISLVAFSFIEHKEFRFVTSLLPLCLYITADTLTRWSYNASRKMLWFIALLIVFGNAIPAWYLSTIHQKGPIEVMSKLQEVAADYRDENNHRANILFLMPCHSTPFYSHIHQNVTMRFLTCEPNLKDEKNYKDEADQFYESPVHWLRSHIPSYPRTAMPTHVVLYEPLAGKVNEFLLNYKELYRIINAEYVQARTGKNILVYQRLRSGEENTFNRDEFRANPNKETIASNIEEANDNGNDNDNDFDDDNMFN
ncbi:GPI mannosyltransferase 3 isoform X2 [Teleopsis dalmanni]|uniref:GPI mannosyltransferase 3 isoform X2 n=1 Tax=Teleopsis dalmanni TaxID=139649 RepID=UPI0018CDA729|nr:GPI mannosyltransferase 3 isoform X2 [Teleopsis dalmanni]